MSVESLPAISKDYINVPVISDIDPTSDPVALAIVPARTVPVAGDWKTAGWKSNTTPPTARLLIGPGTALTLTPATYDVWIKVTDNPEVPIRLAGPLRIT